MVPKGRPPDSPEASALRGLFPSLGEFAITGEPSAAYNCVAWTLGERRWIEAGKSIAQVDRFYASRAFRIVSAPVPGEQVVAAFATVRRFTHVALQLEDDPDWPDWWESKLGQSWRIVHRLHELEGSRYGTVVRFYAKRRDKP